MKMGGSKVFFATDNRLSIFTTEATAIRFTPDHLKA